MASTSCAASVRACPSMTLSEIAAATGLARPTVRRILITLE